MRHVGQFASRLLCRIVELRHSFFSSRPSHCLPHKAKHADSTGQLRSRPRPDDFSFPPVSLARSRHIYAFIALALNGHMGPSYTSPHIDLSHRDDIRRPIPGTQAHALALSQPRLNLVTGTSERPLSKGEPPRHAQVNRWLPRLQGSRFAHQPRPGCGA